MIPRKSNILGQSITFAQNLPYGSHVIKIYTDPSSHQTTLVFVDGVQVYRSPVDSRLHRYFPDFWVKKRDMNGKINISVIEVNPKAQCKRPVKDPKHPRRYLKQVKTFAINEAKWEAATDFCKDRRWQFQIMTEDNLF